MAEPAPGLFNRLSRRDPFRGGFAIPLNATTVFAPTNALNCGSGGTINVTFADGTAAQITMATGQTLEVSVTQCKTGGSASALTGLY